VKRPQSSSVIFVPGPADATKTTIVGTTPVDANGLALSLITIIIQDAFSNAILGDIPIFNATDTGSTNVYGACSASDVSGTSACTLASTKAEDKTLQLTSPTAVTGPIVQFTNGAPVAANSTISGTTPVVADGVATSTVTITLNDLNNNPVAGIVPTFGATNTGTTNTYGVCSSTDATGISTCTLASTKAESKILAIATPVVKDGTTVVFEPGVVDPGTSTITGTTPVLADGVATSTITIILKDANNNLVDGQTPTFSATDTGTTNSYGACSVTTAGVSTCTLSSTVAESKVLTLTAPVTKAGGTVVFTSGIAAAVNSSITGTTPVVADGSATSVVTINLKDINNNPVAGQTPTFNATGSSNTYGSCSVSDASGDSICALSSIFAETKVLSIATPVVKAGNSVVFTSGGAVVANSSISGTTPVVADGVATSTVTITLKDANKNPVVGEIPTFGATNTGSTNVYGTCSAADASGISTCTLSSTKAESKTLAISSPIVKTGTVVVFTAGAADSLNTTISGTTPVEANGVASSTITIVIKDINNNPIAGTTPIYNATDTGTTNTYGACSASDASGTSLCTLMSLKAEAKTLQLTSPVAVTGSIVNFTAGVAIAANSSITGSSPVVADGSATSSVTVTLMDAANNPVTGIIPTFTATDTGTTNNYGVCSSTNASGIATCTLASTRAETKTLSLVTPVAKAGGTVVFTPGAAVAINSSISGTTPVVADGTATSTVTITLKDASNNPVPGQVPTFNATNTGSGNTYGTCSSTDASGISTCTLASTKAESKVLSISTPVTKAGTTVVFNPDVAVAANSSITGTGPVVADGVAISTVTVTLKDANNNVVPGIVPTFGATDTGSTNGYGVCSSTNASGISTCTLTSINAETKTLAIATPVVKSGGAVVFTAGAAVALNSTITGSGPVVANNVASSTVTITLKDASNNPVIGTVPTFGATNTGANNAYGVCSATDASGISTCTLKSLTAETKTLSIATPVVKADGTVVFTAGSAVAANSSITGTSPVVADGSATSSVTITLKDVANNAVVGTIPTFTATNTGSGNTYNTCSATDASGISTCTLSSTKAETKTLSIATPVVKADGTVVFTAGAAVAATSTITGTGPVIADGTSSSTITITLKDINNNGVSGSVPTFSATDTGSTNSMLTCSSSDASGVSTCSLASTKAETKTLSIATPVLKAGGTVVFTAGAAVAGNSSISGTTPIVADGAATSTVTITLKDASNNAVVGSVPTFGATDTSSTNTYGTCSATDSSGISTCTLASTYAESKVLSIVTPVVKAGTTVVFTPGSAVAVNSTISGTTPVVADGTATSTVTITLKDAANNAVPGIVPTFGATDTGSTNNYGVCSSTNASGISTCTMSSLKSESKTLSIATPVIKAGGVTVFTAGAAVALNSSISGTTPVVADGTASSTITITLKDVNNNFVSGTVPTFSASDTGTTNVMSACSSSDISGISTCTLKSNTAESKVLSIATPVVKAGTTVVFTAGSAVALNSTISGTTPVVADGTSTSTVTITLKDASNNPVAGQVPTFGGTDTGITNIYGTCSSSNASGISTCTLASTHAETKVLSILTPVVKAGTSVVFTAGSAVAINSTISGTTPVVADGSATSTVTITLKDAGNNAVSGIVPTFGATDTGTTNTYGTCSSSNASGISTCTLASTKAESKTLSIATPVVKAGGTVVFDPGAAVAVNSTITGTGPVNADGTASSTVTITLKDINNNFVIGTVPTFSATNTGSTNVMGTCSSTNASGVSTCTLKSNNAETKTLAIATPVVKAGGTVVFTSTEPVAANSSISGTSSVVADGAATSTVTITLKDISNNPVAGQTPTFGATDTGTTNTYGSCSVSDASGISTCTLTSTKAEVKTLSILTPVVKAGGTVTFTAGSAFAANSTITGTGSVVADGTATSTITVTLKDAGNNFVSGVVPTFGATDTGTTNTYGTCSSSNASGVSTCTLKSLKAETKTLSIATPVVKADGTVVFTAGSPVAINSTIAGTGPVAADGVATSTVTITLADINNNLVSGTVPTFSATDTGSTNIMSACSSSNASGVSTCNLKSTRAETKTLSIATPFVKAGGTVVFNAGSAVAVNSTIIGTGPVIANNIATSTVTITLRDASNNGVSGIIPTFTATDTGSTNVATACSSSDASGISTCTLKSSKAETKTLSIATPVVKADGSVVFTAGAAIAANSLITGTGPVIADNVATSTITITLKDVTNNPVAGQFPTFNATNTGSTNTKGVCSSSDASGISTCTLKSTKAETKTLSIATPVVKTGGTVVFTAGSADVANSDITGTTPVSADGVSVSFISVSLGDAFGNPVSGTIPIFNATDTNSTNAYGACSSSDSSGTSLCTLSSTKAEVKTLQMTSPIAVTGSATVTFSSSLPTSANSTIAGTGPVVADGIADSIVTITLKDASNNPVAGFTPTFDATDTGTVNTYDICSMSDASGVAVCTFQSLTAETKTLRITNPVLKTGGTVVFTAGEASVANSTISGTGPVVADNVATSTLTITLKDANNNLIAGVVPTFNATNTGSGNTQTACSSSSALGISTCTLKSTKAESKVPSILTPVVKTGTAIVFTAGAAVAVNSSILGTGPVNPDGFSTSVITITLKDTFSNNVSGTVPKFTATGSTNTYGTCTSSDASGVSTCALSSTTAETKTLSIATPVVKAGGTVLFQTGSAVAANSTITGTGPVVADNTAISNITITLKDSTNAPVVAVIPTFTASGTGNTYTVCSATNLSGVSTCTVKSTYAETKTLSIASPVVKADGTVVFIPGAPSALTSTIVASNPTLADGIEACDVTITIKDATGNAISGQTPTFAMTGINNTLGSCPATDTFGESICSVTSTKAQEKTVSLLTPVAVAGNAVDFNPNGINIQVPIEMVDRGLNSSSSAATNFTRTTTSFDPADYVSQSNDYIFEIVADNINATTGFVVNLVDALGVSLTTSNITVPANSSFRRLRVSFTPNSTATQYRVRVAQTSAATGQLKVHSAKIIVEQTAAIASKIYIPLAGGDNTGESSNNTNTAIIGSSTTSTTFVQPVATNFNLWTRADAQYDAIHATNPWTLETVMSISNATAIASTALFNKTSGLQVTEAITNHTGSTALNMRSASFASNATNFTDGSTYEVRIKTNTASRSARLAKAGLWLKLKYLKKAEILHRLSMRSAATTTSLNVADGRFFWDAGAWSNPSVFLQTNALTTTSSIQLYDHGTNDNGITSPTAVAGSTITPTGTYSIQRTGALTLTDQNRYWIRYNWTSGAPIMGGAFLIIRATE
jgi:adhesin/invasin